MIVKLNEIEEYKSKDGEKSFNNNSPIMSLAGIIKAQKSPVPFLSVKYDKNAKFGSVSFSYEMNDDFVKPDEVEEVIDNSTVDNFVNNDFDNQTPEIEMDDSLDDILTDDSFKPGKLQKTIKSVKDKIEEYRSKLTDNALQHTVYDLFDSIEEFKSKYKKIHEYSQNDINEVATIDRLFYSKEAPFSYPIVDDGEKGPNRFKEVFKTNNEIKQLMNELNDLTNSIVRLINSSETNDVMIDDEDLQDDVNDRTC
jgi:methyl-accepting chemotaxis protein